MKNVMKRTGILYAAVSIVATLGLASCKDGKTGGEGNAVIAKFSTTKTSYYTGDEITFTNQSSGGTGTLTYVWDFGDESSSTETSPVKSYSETGIFIVKLTVKDGGSGSAVAQKTIQIEPAPTPDLGDIELKWVGQTYLGDIRSVSPAVDDEGNVVMSSNDNYLRKFSKTDGSVIWSFDMWTTADGTAPAGYTLSSPSIDTDGTIYIGTGSTAPGRFYAVNPTGTKKWMTGSDKDNGFWNNGQPSVPRIVHLTAAVTQNAVFVGNAGTIGSVLAIAKDGTRKGYVTNSAGTGGPAGGVSSGVVLTPDGTLVWAGGVYGVYACSAGSLENGPTVYSWAIYNPEAQRTVSSIGSSMAVGSDGVIYGLGHYNDDFGGPSAFAIYPDGSQKWKTSLGIAGDLDQGGVVVDRNGVVYASVKRTSGGSDGGIVALDGADGSIKWKFQIAEDVSSTPAVDNNGYVHFATESGNYYIIKSDGSADPVIAKKDLAALISESGSTYAEGWSANGGRVWSSPVIADDGTIYVGVVNNITRSKSVLVALSHKDVTGLQSGAPWPMKARDRRHTNHLTDANAITSPAATVGLKNMKDESVAGW